MSGGKRLGERDGSSGGPHPEYETLSALADHELSPTEALKINGHLVECEECREEVDFMVELRDRIRGGPPVPSPAHLLPEILNRRRPDFGEPEWEDSWKDRWRDRWDNLWGALVFHVLARFRGQHPSYETLSAHADETLPPPHAMKVNSHAARCRECREEIDFMAELRERLRGVNGSPPPARF